MAAAPDPCVGARRFAGANVMRLWLVLGLGGYSSWGSFVSALQQLEQEVGDDTKAHKDEGILTVELGCGQGHWPCGLHDEVMEYVVVP